MKKKNLVLASLLLTALLGFESCSNEEEFMPDSADSSVSSESNGIQIVVQTPAPDGIILSRASQESQEWEVKKLEIYLFLKDEAGGDADVDYKLAYQTTGTNQTFTPAGNGSLSCKLDIQESWKGKTAKIALIANDEVTDLSTETPSTLADLKAKLATKALTADFQSADVISGNIFASSSDGATGIPMTAMAKYDNGSGPSESFVIKSQGEALSASLQRIVARVDVYNNTPNLTITDMNVTHAVAKGYLFPQESIADPAEVSYFSMTPTGSYTSALAGTGLAYNSEPGEGTDLQTANTHKHVFYLYEQKNTSESSSAVVIDYKLRINNTDKAGTISIPLKKSAEGLSITRNTLYTVVLGDGNKVEDMENASLTITDWKTDTDTNISGQLTPGTDAQHNNQ